MSWTRDQQWDVFARAGMLALCDVTIGAVVHPGVYVSIAQPDRLFIDGTSQQTDYEMEFETDSLPGLAVGDTIANTKDGTQYAVRSMPHFSSSTGWYSKCNLAMVNRAAPKAPLAVGDGVAQPSGYGMVAAGQSLLAYRVICADGAGHAIHADNRQESHGPLLLGIVLSAAGVGQQVRYQSAGPCTNTAWAWAPDQPVYLGQGGHLTQTPPDDEPGAAFSAYIGFATSATSIVIDIEEPVYL